MKKLLELLHELFVFRCNVILPKSIYNSSINRNLIYKQLKPLTTSMNELTSTNQSFLVQGKIEEIFKINFFKGVEKMEVTDHIKDQIRISIENEVKKHSEISHAILLVGTKYLTIHSKQKSWNLSPKDLFHLIIFANSFKEKKEKKNEQNEDKEIEEEEILENQKNEEIEEEEIFENKEEEKEKEEIIDEIKDDEIEIRNFIFEHVNFVKPNLKITKEYPVFIENYSSNLSLILICDYSIKVPKDSEEEFLKISKIIDESLMSYSFFLYVKSEEGHFNILHYLNYFHLLIHFIYIDRLTNRVIAPRIINLNTTDEKYSINFSVNEIKNLVWKMVQTSMIYRENGFSEIGITEKDYQFWYKETVEDELGTERIGLVRSQIANHFELYTLYLPFISTEIVSKYNKKLVSMITNENK